MSSQTTHKTTHKNHKAGTQHEPHHGTITSYVTGFILSLVFTLIPYYLIVHKTFAKNELLAIILGFALLQMVVQLFFFLHLGREKKPHSNAIFLVSTVGIIFVVVGGSLWIMKNLHYNMAGMDVMDKVAADEALYEVNGKQTGTCPAGTGTNHEVMLMDNTATPSHINAHLCDTITFMNHDSTTREIDFGAPGKVAMYAGKSNMTAYGHHDTVMRLTEAGTHKFHDHKENKMTGDFTVTQ
ncbi:MAG TPA: cytochrome o ubiquinol oxidase subunit IV [Candidatus Saccharimonadales bacterium]|jgi:cytochrome o ubiquinol oxidase operon protein cyoD|nr:cytochrome o ubiquinol oxidase subunit IV [Candidatus Saccharimonadales bacterium]